VLELSYIVFWIRHFTNTCITSVGSYLCRCDSDTGHVT